MLGRLDPETGRFKEYPLTPKAGPHGLTADKDGNIWYTANFGSRVGKLNPKTGELTEYPMPNPAARDPHTPIFDQKGTLWFTVQGGNMVGRFDPKTGEVKLVTAPTPKSRPYGMVVNSKGIPFLVEFGSNKIASIDSNTMAIREYVLPNAETRPRRIAITSDDVLWYSDYSRGYLGRFDPATGKTERVAFSRRPAVTTLWDRRCERHPLVQRSGNEAEYPRALRPEDGKIPNLGDPVRRRRRAQYGRYQRPQPGARLQRCESGSPG